MRVLDTAALLYWPVTEIAGGVCAISQQNEFDLIKRYREMALHPEADSADRKSVV